MLLQRDENATGGRHPGRVWPSLHMHAECGFSVDAPSPFGVMGHDDHTWRRQAGGDWAATSLFLPKALEPRDREPVAEACAVRARCSVREPCRLALANLRGLRIRDRLTEPERHALEESYGAPA
jgi:hypothetical protein